MAFLTLFECIVCIANNINRNVYMYLNTRIFPTTGYARVLLFMFIRRELGGTGTGCLFQITYCVELRHHGTVLLRTFWPEAAYFFKNFNFSTNRHINSLTTLPYTSQESKPGKLKIKPLRPKTRYQWHICYIPINTFSIVKIH